MFNLTSIKNALFSAKGELGKMREQLTTLRQRREELRVLPPPKDELTAMVHQLVDEKADAYPAQLAKSLGHRIGSPLDAPQEVSLTFLKFSSGPYGTIVVDPRSLEHFLCYHHRSAIKDTLRKAIAEMPYSDLVAPRMPERLKEIERLEKEIPELQGKILNVERELREVSGDAAPAELTAQQRRQARDQR